MLSWQAGTPSVKKPTRKPSKHEMTKFLNQCSQSQESSGQKWSTQVSSINKMIKEVIRICIKDTVWCFPASSSDYIFSPHMKNIQDFREETFCHFGYWQLHSPGCMYHNRTWGARYRTSSQTSLWTPPRPPRDPSQSTSNLSLVTYNLYISCTHLAVCTLVECGVFAAVHLLKPPYEPHHVPHGIRHDPPRVRLEEPQHKATEVEHSDVGEAEGKQ